MGYKQDRVFKAKLPGRRVSASGKVYHESRLNRSDAKGVDVGAIRMTRVRSHRRKTATGTTQVVKHERRLPKFMNMKEQILRGEIKAQINTEQTIAIMKNHEELVTAMPWFKDAKIIPAHAGSYQSTDYYQDGYADKNFIDKTVRLIGGQGSDSYSVGIDKDYYNYFRKDGWSFHVYEKDRPIIAKKGSKIAVIAPRVILD